MEFKVANLLCSLLDKSTIKCIGVLSCVDQFEPCPSDWRGNNQVGLACVLSYMCSVFLCLGVMGAVVAPLAFLGGPLLIRAAWYTAGIVGGLSTVAMCAPSEKFLNMGGPLGIGLGFVIASSIGKILLQYSHIK